MKIFDVTAFKKIACAVTEMQVEIENQSPFNKILILKPGQSYGDIIEIAEPPAMVGAGMMSRRPDEAKTGFTVHGYLSCLNSATGGQAGDIVDMFVPFD